MQEYINLDPKDENSDNGSEGNDTPDFPVFESDDPTIKSEIPDFGDDTNSDSIGTEKE